MTRVIKPESGEKPKALRLDEVNHCGFPEMMDIRWLPALWPLSGHGGADYRVRETLGNSLNKSFEKLSSNKKISNEATAGRPSGRWHLSQAGDAHAAGVQPPRASMKNRKCTEKILVSLKHHDGGAV
jgi:hypothetical protein